MSVSQTRFFPMFKNIRLSGAVGLALSAAALLSSSPSMAASDYVLTCNPGQRMEIVTGQRVSSQEAFAIINFKPGRTGAASHAPRPGECTWTDRGFRPGEPTKLMFRANGKWVQSVCSNRGCSTRSNSQGIMNLVKYVRRGQPFVVRAYNDRHGTMIITRVGP